MENIVRGLKNSLQEDFGIYLFNSIKSSDQEAILMVDADTDEETSVKIFHENVIRFFYALKELTKRGDVIACVGENEPITLVPIAASIYLGTTIAMVNPTCKKYELSHYFTMIKPKIILCTSTSLQNIVDLKPQFGCIENIILMQKETVADLPTISDLIKRQDYRNLEDFQPERVDQDDPALIAFSSGTSGGLSKAVQISYTNLTATAVSFNDPNYIGMTFGVTALPLEPYLYYNLFAAMFQTKTIFVKGFDPKMILDAVHKYKVEKLILIPFVASLLCDSNVDGFDLTNLTDAVSSSAPLAAHVIESFKAKFKVTVRQAYGLTEVGLVSCVQPNAPSKRGSCGVIAPNLEVAIKDVETRTVLPRNESGEICVRGPAVLRSYGNNPEANGRSFDGEGFFLTGDYGYFDDDGCLYVIDRLKELIRCHDGFRVSPGELEEVLLTHPAVEEVAVIGVPDQRGGESPCGVVKRRKRFDVVEEELIKFLGDRVSFHKQLTGGIKFVDDMPKNATGKIMKRSIRERLAL